MRRFRTQLELNLIKKGWKLSFKTYVGKHSDKVKYYAYEKTYKVDKEKNNNSYLIHDDQCLILLDQKREKVVDIRLGYFGNFVDKTIMFILKNKLAEIESEVKSCLPNKEDLSVEEQVEVAECVGGNDE